MVNKKRSEEVVEKLKGLRLHSDIEDTHIKADKLLCDLLIQLGYKDVVDEFEKLSKWYS